MSTVFPTPAPPANTKLTKRSFWNRFPVAKERTMRAIMAQGSPALLAGTFATLHVRVESSPFVDVSLEQTQLGVASLASELIPETVEVEGVICPLRFTPQEVAFVLRLPEGDEAYTG